VSVPQTWFDFSTCEVFWISHGDQYTADAVEAAQGDLRRLLKLIQKAQAAPDDETVKGGRLLRSRGRSDVASCTFSKDIDSPAGVFQMALYPNQDYLDIIKADDLMVIVAGTKRGAELVVSVCLVDTVSESAPVDSGTETVTVHVNGRDLGKVLVETSTIFDPAFGEVQNGLFNEKYLNQFSQSFSGTPVEIVSLVWNLFYGGATGNQIVDSQWRFPGAPKVPLVALLDLKTFVQAPMFGCYMPSPIMLAEHGNVWNLMRSLANEVVNEMFIDVRDLTEGHDAAERHLEEVAAAFVPSGEVADQQDLRDLIADTFTAGNSPQQELEDLTSVSRTPSVLALTFRQMPYDTDTFDLLPTRVVYETECDDTSFSKSSHEVKNFFRIRSPVLPPVAQEILYGVLINKASIMAHGIKRLEGETAYPFAGKDLSLNYAAGRAPKADLTPAVYDYYVGLLALWNAYNERLYSGSIPMRYRPDIRVGQKLRYIRTRRGKAQVFDFYVQGVRHSFSDQPGASRSVIQVVRGIRRDRGEDRPESNLHWDSGGPRYLKDDRMGPYVRLSDDGLTLQAR